MAPRPILRCRARAILCILLVLHLHMPGCTQQFDPLTDEWIAVPLGPGHPLASALANSVFAGATAVEINPALLGFRIHSPDGTRVISGAMGKRGDQAAVRSFRISSESAALDIVIDGADRIVQISAEDGVAWQRPMSDEASNLNQSLLDAYQQMNEVLVDAARAMDGEETVSGGLPGNSPPPPLSGKVAQADQNINTALTNVLGMLTALVGPQFVFGNFPALYFAFQVFVSMQVTFGLLGLTPSESDGSSGGGGTPSGNPVPQTTATGSSSARADATLRVSNVLTSGVPIWYVVPVPNAGEAAVGNLLGNAAIPAGSSRDFKLPPGLRTINLICPAKGDCLRVYSKSGVELESGEITNLVLSTGDRNTLYPADCGG